MPLAKRRKAWLTITEGWVELLHNNLDNLEIPCSAPWGFLKMPHDLRRPDSLSNPETHPWHASQLLQLLGAQAGEHALLQILLPMGVGCGSLLLPGCFPLLRHVILPQLLQELVLHESMVSLTQMPRQVQLYPGRSMWHAVTVGGIDAMR